MRFVYLGANPGCDGSLNLRGFFLDENDKSNDEKRDRGKDYGQELNPIFLLLDQRVAVAFRAFDFGIRFPAQFTLPAFHVFLELGGFGLKDLHELTLGHGSLVVLLDTGQCFVELALFFLQNLLD